MRSETVFSFIVMLVALSIGCGGEKPELSTYSKKDVPTFDERMIDGIPCLMDKRMNDAEAKTIMSRFADDGFISKLPIIWECRIGQVTHMVIASGIDQQDQPDRGTRVYLVGLQNGNLSIYDKSYGFKDISEFSPVVFYHQDKALLALGIADEHRLYGFQVLEVVDGKFGHSSDLFVGRPFVDGKSSLPIESVFVEWVNSGYVFHIRESRLVIWPSHFAHQMDLAVKRSSSKEFVFIQRGNKISLQCPTLGERIPVSECILFFLTGYEIRVPKKSMVKKLRQITQGDRTHLKQEILNLIGLISESEHAISSFDLDSQARDLLRFRLAELLIDGECWIINRETGGTLSYIEVEYSFDPDHWSWETIPAGLLVGDGYRFFRDPSNGRRFFTVHDYTI